LGYAGKKLPTIGMAHGWDGTKAAFRPEVVAFAQAGYLVVASEQDRVLEAYHERLDRMVAVKSHYDPNNLFRLNQNVPPRNLG
jgi:FAD/FMN-containing dehydrogenase